MSKSRLMMMIRDNGSNFVKACNEWGVNHFGCVAHGFHLIVSPFSFGRKPLDGLEEPIETPDGDEVMEWNLDEVYQARPGRPTNPIGDASHRSRSEHDCERLP